MKNDRKETTEIEFIGDTVKNEHVFEIVSRKHLTKHDLYHRIYDVCDWACNTSYGGSKCRFDGPNRGAKL